MEELKFQTKKNIDEKISGAIVCKLTDLESKTDIDVYSRKIATRKNFIKEILVSFDSTMEQIDDMAQKESIVNNATIDERCFDKVIARRVNTEFERLLQEFSTQDNAEYAQEVVKNRQKRVIEVLQNFSTYQQLHQHSIATKLNERKQKIL